MVDISTGGVRDRLIRDAVATVIKAGLEELGWFDTGRQNRVVRWRDEPVTGVDEEVPLNTITCSSEDMRPTEIEVGTLLTEDRWEFWVDFYGESEAVAKQVVGDVRDLLRGKHPSIGRTAPVIPVYDVTQEPVPAEPVFYLEVEDVETDRARNTSKPFEQFWFSVDFTVVDTR